MSILRKDEEISKDIIYRLFVAHESFKDVVTSERDLASRYSVSRNTLRKALQILVSKDIIMMTDTGYSLSPRKIDYDTSDALLLSNSDFLTNQILQSENTEANKDISKLIKQPLGTKIQIITYLRRNQSGFLVSIDKVIFHSTDIDIWQFSKISAVKLLSLQNGKPFEKEYQELSIHTASNYECQILNLEKDTSTLLRKSLFTSNDKNIFVYLESIKKWDNTLILQPNSEIFNKVGGFIE